MMRFLLGALLLLVLAGCGVTDDYPDLIESDLLPYFRAEFPNQQIVLMIEGDANDDGIDDLVVVFRADPEHNHKVTVFSTPNGFKLTEPMPAPFQDVDMEFININDQPPNELMISGRRGINFGLGILRFYDNQWVDLFGGLDGCC
ncbi:MAG: hypothetical protein FWD97_00165 [Defluviitaleaceae bacterium]|nr:hypothetical protein [Defluviitaleaceae bacterium]